MKVELIDTEENVKELIIENKSIGELIRDVDGYFYYWPSPSLKGSWNARALRFIADKLDEANSEIMSLNK